jgi:hypothetical protein
MNTLELFDSNGSHISIKRVDDKQVSIDATNFPGGIYTARISTERGVIIRRVAVL